MKDYWVSFGSGNPAIYTGLSLSFLQFGNATGSTFAVPGITEMYPGRYRFQYDVGVTTNIVFTIDGGATLGAATSTLRFVSGVLDPMDQVNLQVGSTVSSFGTTAFPGDLFGFAKRQSEWLEGAQQFVKNSGQWSIYNRGASVLLGLKTLTNSTTGVTAIP